MIGPIKPMAIEKEYEKNPDISADDIRKLREWLQTQPHLPGEHLTDMDLVIAYHCCQNSMEVSKQVIDLHFTLRTLFTQFFKDRAFDKRAEFALNTVLCVPFAAPTEEGYRVVYFKLLDNDPRSFNLTEAVRSFMMAFDLWQYEEGTWPGFIILIDMDQTALGHLTRLDPMVLKKVLYFLQECMFVKLKGVHFLNAPYFMDKLMSLLRAFVKKEFVELMFVHQVGSDSLYKHVPKKNFPKEEGGENKDHITLRDDLSQRLRAHSEFIKNDNKRRVNEALRPGGKPATVEEMFGIQGSFKKLDID